MWATAGRGALAFYILHSSIVFPAGSRVVLLCDTVSYSSESLLSWQLQWFKFLHQSSTWTQWCPLKPLKSELGLPSGHTLSCCTERPKLGTSRRQKWLCLVATEAAGAGVLLLEAQWSPTGLQGANSIVFPVLADLFFFALQYRVCSLLISFTVASKLQS